MGGMKPRAVSEPANERQPEVEAFREFGDRDREILDFERQWWKYAGAKEDALRELFAMSPTRYYQLLNALIDHPDAEAYDPMLVKRLRRLRAARHRTRSGVSR